MANDTDDVFFLLRCRCGKVMVSRGDTGFTAKAAQKRGWRKAGVGWRCSACAEVDSG